jgi:glycine cleavage system H protein
VAVNEDLGDSPERINEDPYGEGWLVRVRLAEPSEVDSLLDASSYEQLLESSG